MLTTCRNAACKKSFTAERPTAYYCSGRCRTAAHRKRAEPVPAPFWYDGKRRRADDELAEHLLVIADRDDDGAPKTGRRYYYLALSHGYIAVDMSDTPAGKKSREAGYKTVTAPLGKRLEKKLNNGVLIQIDLYSPREFSGLGDFAHFANFQKALSEHEVVAYDGHSMLGASDFWTRPDYPDFYQIYLYGGCLGYEYYIKPILHGKGDSWAKLDIMSSVIEVTADATDFAAPALAKILFAIENGKRSSWKQILNIVRDSVGDSTFGVSGVRENCYKPGGNRC
jgi:hypothetical protein